MSAYPVGMTVTMDTGSRYAAAVAGEVRAMMARRQRLNKDLAKHLGVSAMWVSRRMSGEVPWDVAELSSVAGFLGCSVTDLLPRLDSNQKPAGCGSDGYRPQGYRRGGVALAA